jgi:hypothetical protein
MPSSRLDQKLTKEDKPWLDRKQKRERASWWLTLLCMFLGVAGAVIICFFGWTGVRQLKDEDLCLVFSDDFSSLDLQNSWSKDIELGGFG